LAPPAIPRQSNFIATTIDGRRKQIGEEKKTEVLEREQAPGFVAKLAQERDSLQR